MEDSTDVTNFGVIFKCSFKKMPGAREMAEWIKYFLREPEEPSLDPQHIHRKPSVLSVPVVPALGHKSQESPRDLLVGQPSSRFSETLSPGNRV